MSFFFGKKDKKSLQVQPPAPAPSSPSPASPLSPSSPSPPIAPLTSSPLTTASPVPHLLPYSPLAPSSPLTAHSAALPSTVDPTVTLSIKKTKKKNGLLSIFTNKNKQPKPTNDSLSPTLSPASLSPNALSEEKKKKGMFGGIFKRKKKQKTLVKNDKGEEEEREISVSVTVSRLHRIDDEDDGLTSYEDDILIFPIFGIPLKKIMDIKQGVLNERGVDGEAGGAGGAGVNYLPKQMVDLCEYIRAVGLQTEGVFRISGESETIKEMKERIDRGEELELVPASGSGEAVTEAASNIHNLTGLFKLYWRSLGEPLFPFSHYEQLIAAVDAQSLPTTIPPLLTTLPEPNKSIVAYLLSFLSDVTSHFQHNKMTPLNLAVCFAPNLLRAKEEKAERVMVDAPKVVQLLCYMIEDEGKRREEERRREREEEESREQRREEERREREAEVMVATQRAKERRKQQEEHERDEQQREQQQREQQEAIEREIEEQMEQERQRKERQLAHLRDQDAKRKQRQREEREEDERRKRLAAKKAQQTVLEHLPVNRARSATDGESEAEAPSFFAIPNPQSPVVGASGGRRLDDPSSILPPFASSQLPVVILMPTSSFSSSAPPSSAASSVSSPSSSAGSDRVRSLSSNTASRFAATTPTLPTLPSPAAGFVVQVVDEDERIVLSQGNQANEPDDEQKQPSSPSASTTTYYTAASPSSSPPSESSEPVQSSVHIRVQPLPSDSPPSCSDGEADDEELSSMMRRLSVAELSGLAAGGAGEEERRRSEVARLEEALKGKRAEEEERRREQQIERLAEAMREKEERKKKNQQRKEDEERDRQKEKEALRASLHQHQAAGKEEEERKENTSSQLPELSAGEDYFQMLP